MRRDCVGSAQLNLQVLFFGVDVPEGNVFSSKCRQRSMNPYGVKLIRPSAARGAAPGHQGDLNAAVTREEDEGLGSTLFGDPALSDRVWKDTVVDG
ncbi:hypothetical protein DPX16_1551 [Anabarilius grahami]|uniref:Uncharacterized protein n=1 Tax=Anabarilius grahami TaxID=495550 RepID=A0A3N0XSK8_ANAGA|nr:hypothetical protein DPX16_1551 [Anabarilius grahami]